MSRHVQKRRLASIVRDRGVLDVVDAVDIALDVCEALANLHAEGVVHGGLTPECIRVPWPRPATPGTVEIFAVGACEDLTMASLPFDAPHAQPEREYAAPEQRLATSTVDTRADLWAVGALLHRMLFGAPPCTGRRLEANAVPSSLALAIAACLEAQPAARPQTIDDLAGRIASFASSPAERYVRLAERRATSIVPRNAIVEPRARESLVALDRLHQAAIDRELAAGRPPTLSVVVPMREVMLPPRSIEVEALAPLSSLGDEISEENVVYAAAPASLADVDVGGSGSPSIAPVFRSVAPDPPTSRSPRAPLQRLPLLAYAAALTLSAIFGFRFARTSALSAAPRETQTMIAPQEAVTDLPAPAGPEMPPPAVVGSASAGAPPALVATPESLPNASSPPRLPRAARSASKVLPRPTEEKVTEPQRADDPVLQDSARR